jgi:hypothetical protein
MDHSDVTTSVATVITIGTAGFGWLIAWLLRHGARITGAEVRIEGLGLNAETDRRRSDALHQDIRATLVRIEDKLDRKADR